MLLLLLGCTGPAGDRVGEPGTVDPAGEHGGDDDSGSGGGGAAGAGGAGGGGDTGSASARRAWSIGLWCGPPVDELTSARFTELADAGLTRVSNACEADATTVSANQTLLTLAEAAGLEAVLTDSRGTAAGQGSDPTGNIAALLADYGSSSALRGFRLVDEPSAPAFAGLASAVDALAAADPDQLAAINLLPDYASTAQWGTATYADYLAGFLDTVGPAAFTYDHYNFLSDGSDGTSFFANLASVRDAATARGVPWGMYVQAISYSGHRATTGPEKRWAAMHTLAYGGTEVDWFTWWTPPENGEGFGSGIIGADGVATSQLSDVTDIDRSLAAYLPWLAAATSTGVFHNGALATGAVPRVPSDLVYVPSTATVTVGEFRWGGQALALVVNRDHTATTSTDLLVGGSSVEVLDVASGAFTAVSTWADALGTRWTASLAPGDAALYRLDAVDGPVGAEAYLGIVRSDAGWLDVADARAGSDRLRAASWDDCPAGTTLLGHTFTSNGFWLCAPDAYAGHTYYVGNVVADSGELFSVAGGTATSLGAGGWGTCPAGSFVAMRFESDGWWLCMA